MAINVVIPAAGIGSRFRAVGIDTPKPLIPILGIPMICWVIGNFDLEAKDHIYVISRKEDRLPETMRVVLGHFKQEISYIEIDALTDGAATTLEFALKEIKTNDPVLCVNSDQFVSSELIEFLKSVRFGSTEGQILSMNADGNKWSYVERDKQGRVIRVVEKEQISNEATVGIYGWRSTHVAQRSIEEMKMAEFRVNGEFYVAPSYTFLAAAGGEISTTNIGDVETEVHGLGTPEDLEIFLSNPNLNIYLQSVRQRLGLSSHE